MSSARVAPEPPAAEQPAPSTAELTAPSTADVPFTSGCEQNVGDRRQQEDTFVQFDDLNKLVADLAPSVARDVRRAYLRDFEEYRPPATARAALWRQDDFAWGCPPARWGVA